MTETFGAAAARGETGETGETERARTGAPVLTAVRTTMPIMLTSSAGVEESLRALSQRLTHRPAASRPPQRLARPGELAYCGIWFPPVAIPVGFRQVRMSRQLPVLTVVSAYSGWIAAVLIPSTGVPDLDAGCWQALAQLGGVPRRLSWATGAATGEWSRFCDALGSSAAPADEQAKNALAAAHAYLERSFLSGQAVRSPGQFNEQLAQWLAIDNHRQGPGEEPAPGALASDDRRAMLPLPERFPGTRWRIRTTVADRPYVSFDSNHYSVDSVAIGKPVVITADLTQVEVFCDDELVAAHPRAWARAASVSHPAHVAVRQDRPASAGARNRR